MHASEKDLLVRISQKCELDEFYSDQLKNGRKVLPHDILERVRKMGAPLSTLDLQSLSGLFVFNTSTQQIYWKMIDDGNERVANKYLSIIKRNWNGVICDKLQTNAVQGRTL
jgi:hypothetical protein